MRKYFIRLDDACPTMKSDCWNRMESLLDNFGIKPMVGLIPNNQDPIVSIDPEDPNFWNRVQSWNNKGWTLALHGYNHTYTSSKGMEGLNPIWRRSEFSGLSLKEQENKIKNGVSILKDHNVHVKYFFAPSHTFDDNTLLALRNCSDIRIISDCMSLYPFRYEGFYIIPQQFGHCVPMPIGYWTFCFHPNTMNDADFENLESFMIKYAQYFDSFDNIDLPMFDRKKITDCLFEKIYFLYRKLRKIE